MRITGVNHITLSVKNLDDCLIFYRDILGCKEIGIWDSGAYLLAGNIWLCLSKDKSAAKCVPAEYSHIAFSFDSDNFDDIRKYFDKHKVEYWKDNMSEGDSLYILDPSYNKLEIHNSTLASRVKSLKNKPYSGLHIFTENP